MPSHMKPREKALNYGIKSLTDAELMALIFAVGLPGKNVLQMCAEILADNEYHISRLARMNPREVMKRYKGIGPAKALTMLAALELGSRAAADAVTVEDPDMLDSSKAYRYMHPKIGMLDHEEFWVMFLRRNNRVIRAIRIGQGGLSSTAVDIKIIMREALLASCSGMMLFHNHPSGNTKPSPQDIALTEKIVKAAALLEINVFDHLIICTDSYYSFHDSGIMPRK